MIHFFGYFLCFNCKTCVFCKFGVSIPLWGRAGPAPPPFSRVEILKKFSEKNVPENCTLFFGQNWLFRGFCLYFNAARPFGGALGRAPPLLFLGWKYWKSSEEKVSRKTVLYFFWRKDEFFHGTIYHCVRSRSFASPSLKGARVSELIVLFLQAVDCMRVVRSLEFMLYATQEWQVGVFLHFWVHVFACSLCLAFAFAFPAGGML